MPEGGGVATRMDPLGGEVGPPATRVEPAVGRGVPPDRAVDAPAILVGPRVPATSVIACDSEMRPERAASHTSLGAMRPSGSGGQSPAPSPPPLLTRTTMPITAASAT